MTPKVFSKLLGLFVLLLVFHTVVMETLFHGFVERSGQSTLGGIGREALWAGLIALAVAIPLAAWLASRISARLRSRSRLRPPHRRRRPGRPP